MKVGPYEVVRELGRGGMGVVYEVRHPEIDRPLALKVLLSGQGPDWDPTALARFGREAELLAKIDHPNVLKIHTLARTPEGHPYLVTDYVEGKSLKAERHAGPMPWRRAAELVRDLAVALAAVHAKGIVHRDLKPDNVIVRPDGTPVVLDFGIARDDSVEKLTKSGTLLGTLSYMAPEQAGGGGKLDGRTDVYALGAILYFLLTGHAPFEDGASAQVMMLLLTQEPRWPAQEDPTIDRDLDAICRRAMAKDRLVRTRDAATLAQELTDWLGGKRSKRSGRAPLIAVVALLMAGGVAVALSRKDEAPPPPPAPIPPPAKAVPRALPVPSLPAEWGPARYRALMRERRSATPNRAREIDVEVGREKYAGKPLARLELLQTGLNGATEDFHTGRVVFLDDTHLVSRHRKRAGLHVWDLAAPTQPVVVGDASPGNTHWLTLDAHGNDAYFAASEEELVRWTWRGNTEPAPAKPVFRVPQAAVSTAQERRALMTVVVSTDGSRLLVGGTYEDAWVLDAKAGSLLLTIGGHPNSVVSGAFSRDGSLVAMGTVAVGTGLESNARTLAVFDLSQKQVLDEPTSAGMRVDGLVFLPRTERVLAWTPTAGGFRWHAYEGKAPTLPREAMNPGPEDPRIRGVAVSPAGDRLYSIGDDTTGRVLLSYWDVEKGKLLKSVKVRNVPAFPSDPTLGVDVSPDGLLLVVSTGNDDIFDVFPAYLPGESPP